jgi:uncharacterized membrane protein YphA (DoxX/SURF4 family)
MSIFIHIALILTALAFTMAGLAKATQPKAKLAKNMAWTDDFSQGQIRIIGILEILGGLGVILPAITNILTWLTPIAAAGLMLIMVGAALTHIRRKEYPLIAVNAVLFTLATVVLIGYWELLPF